MIRKITSKEDEEKRKRKNQIIVGVVLVFLMLISTIGYSFGSNSSTNTTPIIKYNGYEFTTNGIYWSLNIGGTVFNFANHPKNTYLVESEVKPLTSYYGKPLYIYSESPGAEAEIRENLYTISNETTNACLEGDTCAENITVKTCANNFIIIKESSNTKVYQEEGCVYIEGQAEDLIKITDGFLLKIIGVK